MIVVVTFTLIAFKPLGSCTSGLSLRLSGSWTHPFCEFQVDRRPTVPETHERPSGPGIIDVNEVHLAVLLAALPGPFHFVARLNGGQGSRQAEGSTLSRGG